MLENAKAEARKENEMLQENIVRICTSVLENFGPRTVDQRRNSNYQIKSRGKLKCHERIASRLRKKVYRFRVTEYFRNEDSDIELEFVSRASLLSAAHDSGKNEQIETRISRDSEEAKK